VVEVEATIAGLGSTGSYAGPMGNPSHSDRWSAARTATVARRVPAAAAAERWAIVRRLHGVEAN